MFVYDTPTPITASGHPLVTNTIINSMSVARVYQDNNIENNDNNDHYHLIIRDVESGIEVDRKESLR